MQQKQRKFSKLPNKTLKYAQNKINRQRTGFIVFKINNVNVAIARAKKFTKVIYATGNTFYRKIELFARIVGRIIDGIRHTMINY